MLGGTQQAVDYSDQGNGSLNGLEVPQLIPVPPFGLPLFVIEFNGPAVASDASDTRRLPPQAVGDVEDRAIAPVRLAMVDDQTLPAKFGYAVGGAVTGVTLLLPFGGNGDG
jgi:hypothetical protein